MSKVEFNYNGNYTIVLCKENEKMEEICKRFIKIEKDLTSINDLDFFYLGNKINLELTLSQIIGEIKAGRITKSKINVDVNKLEKFRNKNIDKIIESRKIIIILSQKKLHQIQIILLKGPIEEEKEKLKYQKICQNVRFV